MTPGEALRAGHAVIVPNPAPLTHVITARSQQAVNNAKGRPADQSVALWCHADATLTRVEQCLDLDERSLSTARRLLRDEYVTLLVPLWAPPPVWLRPAVQDGWALLFGACWPPIASFLDDHPILYVSSANRTGEPPVSTAAEARAMFGAQVPIVEVPAPGTEVPAPGAGVPAPGTGVPAPAPAAPSSGTPPVQTAAAHGGQRRATTTLRMRTDGSLMVHRIGAQDPERLLRVV